MIPALAPGSSFYRSDSQFNLSHPSPVRYSDDSRLTGVIGEICQPATFGLSCGWGVLGAASGEFVADLVAQSIINDLHSGKTINNLSESEKQSVGALSTLPKRRHAAKRRYTKLPGA